MKSFMKFSDSLTSIYISLVTGGKLGKCLPKEQLHYNLILSPGYCTLTFFN